MQNKTKKNNNRKFVIFLKFKSFPNYFMAESEY